MIRLVLALLLAALLATACFAETAPTATPAPDDLNSRLQQCEQRFCLTVPLLQQRKLAKFQQSISDIKAQRALVADFERYAAWMTNNLAAYNRYIQAGSAAAAVTKFLPIPYAGEAAVFSKFVAQFSQSLSTTSKALNTYLQVSQQVLTRAAALDSSNPDPKALSELHATADSQLLKAMLEANQQLKGIAELSAGAQAFLVGLNTYLATGDEYLHKMKGVFKKEPTQQEKSFLTESTTNLKTQTELFNTRLKNFETIGAKITTTIKSLTVYDELAAEKTTK